MCNLNLPVQWVYDVLDCVLWVPHRVEHYKPGAFHTKYEQNPAKTADIDIQAYIHALDISFMYEYKNGMSRSRLTKRRRDHYIGFVILRSQGIVHLCTRLHIIVP